MKRMMALICLLPLAACSSPEERAKLEAEKEISECTKAGYQPDTPAFDDCRLQVRSLEEQRRADRIAAVDHLGQTSSGHSGSPPQGYSIPLP